LKDLVLDLLDFKVKLIHIKLGLLQLEHFTILTFNKIKETLAVQVDRVNFELLVFLNLLLNVKLSLKLVNHLIMLLSMFGSFLIANGYLFVKELLVRVQ